MLPTRPLSSLRRPGRYRRSVIHTLASLACLLTPTLSPAMTTESRSDGAGFDWNAAWEEAEEQAREEQRLLEKARRVNEGELTFITTPPDPEGARMDKRLALDPQSLEDGWAEMTQCHHHLDPAPAVQIVYNAERTRDIRITRRDGVGEARVDGPSVQMRGIERGASLCVAARVLAIEPHPENNGFLVENGPFMRRFLDGYYPMQVRLAIRWPDGLLTLAESEPPPQPGLRLETNSSGVSLVAHFEGRLVSRLHLLPGPAFEYPPGSNEPTNGSP